MVELIGNEPVREHLALLADEGRLHHCLLFEGPAGVGKAGTARWLAMRTNCEAEPAERPCGRCWSCRQIEKGQHPDVVEVGLDPERTAPIISVRQARALTDSLRLRPFSARRRFVIIDPAEALTAESANALLKTLEEPPEATGFILVVPSANRLLPTVRSRSQRVRFRPIEEARLLTWLESRGIAEPARIARQADGSPGRALSLAEGEDEALRADRDQLIEVLDGSLDALMSHAEALVKGDRAAWTERVERVLQAALQLGRDAFVLQTGEGRAWLYNEDRRPEVERWAQALGTTGVGRVAEIIARSRADLAAFANGRLVVEAALLEIKRELGRR